MHDNDFSPNSQNNVQAASEEDVAAEIVEEGSYEIPADLEAEFNQVESGQSIADVQQQLLILKAECQSLQHEVQELQTRRDRLLREQTAGLQAQLEQFVHDYLTELQQRKQSLQASIEQLERRQERLRNEMRTTFAGTSQELAMRVQGFKDYLTGSLQDLVTAAEQLQLVPSKPAEQAEAAPPSASTGSKQPPPTPQFAEQAFQDQAKKIRNLLDRYRTSPDYYGPPWQLRRTFEPVHADRVSKWFFDQGGRGAMKTMGSRLQNILVASTVISVLYRFYGDYLRTLVLADSPERLGEWRRGLQDCLGISRADFGPDQGIVLFESPEPLIAKADRLLKDDEMPLIIIDDSEDKISLALLQFPLWLAFAADPQLSRNSWS